MEKIRDEIVPLIRYAVKCSGSFHPNCVIPQIQESLTLAELNEIEGFLRWVVSNKKTFGWNLPDVYQEYVDYREKRSTDDEIEENCECGVSETTGKWSDDAFDLDGCTCR